jgi:hypothetical protein
VPYELWRVPDPAPELAWPEQVILAPSPAAGVAAVALGRVPRAVAVVSRPVAQTPASVLRLDQRTADRWVFTVESAGGVAVLRTAYHPIWRARDEAGRALATQPVEVALLGVEVPPGAHTVTAEIGAGPERAAGLAALAGAGLLLVVAARRW